VLGNGILTLLPRVLEEEEVLRRVLQQDGLEAPDRGEVLLRRLAEGNDQGQHNQGSTGAHAEQKGLDELELANAVPSSTVGQHSIEGKVGVAVLNAVANHLEQLNPLHLLEHAPFELSCSVLECEDLLDVRAGVGEGNGVVEDGVQVHLVRDPSFLGTLIVRFSRFLVINQFSFEFTLWAYRLLLY